MQLPTHTHTHTHSKPGMSLIQTWCCTGFAVMLAKCHLTKLLGLCQNVDERSSSALSSRDQRFLQRGVVSSVNPFARLAHTRLHVFAVFLNFLFLSCCCSDAKPRELSSQSHPGGNQRPCWSRSSSLPGGPRNELLFSHSDVTPNCTLMFELISRRRPLPCARDNRANVWKPAN